MAATQALVKPNPVTTLRSWLDKSKEQIAVALPRHMDPDRMIRVAITAIQKQPKLLECSPLSIVGCVIEASQLGLYPDGILGDAYLVPFYNGKTKQMEAQLQPGYRGLINLARRSGQVSAIYSEPVYACDKFKVELGTEHTIVHEPNYDDPDRGIQKDENSVPVGLRGVYAVVKFTDGTADFEYMPLHRIMEIRNSSKSKYQGEVIGPWVSHFEEMARKTPIRRLAKRLPLSPEFQKAAILDEYVDAGVAPDAADVVDVHSEVMRLATEEKATNLDEKYRQSNSEGPSAVVRHTTAAGETSAPPDPSAGKAVEASAPSPEIIPEVQERRKDLHKQGEEIARRLGKRSEKPAPECVSPTGIFDEDNEVRRGGE